ncbi:MAG: DUF4349 domain-containing protein [Chloroflexota bacterium]
MKSNSKAILGLLLVAIMVGGMACARAPQALRVEEWTAEKGMADNAVGAPAPMEVPALEMQEEYRSNTYADEGIYTGDQLIIRTANWSVVVSDTLETMEAINNLVVSMNGWVAHSNVWESNGFKRASISVNVPVESLDAFLDTLREMAEDVPTESMSSQNVTEEFVDLQARLDNTEATAERVRSFLDSARTVKDALSVNQELSRLEEQIERLKGRMNYLETSARYSSVNIDIVPSELNRPVTVGKWQPKGTALNAIRALISFLQWLIDRLIYLVILILPVILLVFVPIYVIIRYVNRRRKQRKQSEE